jgi:hypothetical protein
MQTIRMLAARRRGEPGLQRPAERRRKAPAVRTALWCILGLTGLFIGIAASHAGYSRIAGPAIPFLVDFDTTDLDGWTWAGATQFCCAHSASVTEDPVKPGNKVLSIHLRRGDPLVKGSTRAEFRTRAVSIGSSHRYSWRSFVPEEWELDDSPVSFAQWHNVQDLVLAERGVPPPLQLWIIRDRVLVVTRSDTRLVSSSYFAGGWFEEPRVLWSAPLEKGRWTEWSFQVAWSYGGDGIVKAWKDGVPIIDYRGPNAFNDMTGPYFKAGIYVSDWAEGNSLSPVRERSMMFDDIAVTEDAPSSDDGALEK